MEEEKEEGDQELFPSLALKGGMLTVGSSRFVIEDAVYPSGPGVFYAEVIYDDTLEDYWYGVYFEADLPAVTIPNDGFAGSRPWISIRKHRNRPWQSIRSGKAAIWK